MATDDRVVDSDKVWVCLITNASYLPGLLTLNFSLRRVGSKYPLVALHTGTLPDETLRALRARDIPLQRVPHLRPEPPPESASISNGDNKSDDNDENTWYTNDPRFRECFTKLAVFSLTGYSRIVLLDADMLVRRNMDELFDLPLDGENRLFAATHACVCNPLHFRHYPPTFTPGNCPFTTQHTHPDAAQTTAPSNNNPDPKPDPSPNPNPSPSPPPNLTTPLLNGGLLTLTPSPTLTSQITTYLHSAHATPANLPFADQSLLSTLFRGRWVPLPYVYNALKTMRWGDVHGAIWRDECVKNVHYILVPKPWERYRRASLSPGVGLEVGGGTDEGEGEGEGEGSGKKGGGEGHDDDETDRWWREVDLERRRWEAERGLDWNGHGDGDGKRTGS